jgi:hypothetical protein
MVWQPERDMPELLASFGFSSASGASCALLLSLIALSIEV